MGGTAKEKHHGHDSCDQQIDRLLGHAHSVPCEFLTTSAGRLSTVRPFFGVGTALDRLLTSFQYAVRSKHATWKACRRRGLQHRCQAFYCSLLSFLSHFPCYRFISYAAAFTSGRENTSLLSNPRPLVWYRAAPLPIRCG